MTIEKLEEIKNQALALDVKIVVINYDVDAYSVSVKGHLFTKFRSALTAITTSYLKSKR